MENPINMNWETDEGGVLEFDDKSQELHPWSIEGITELEALLGKHAAFLAFLDTQEQQAA
jgi:hypothetical protein